jgi:FkbM family methyltransferase
MSLRLTLPFLWRHPLLRGQRPAALGRYVRWQLASQLIQGVTGVPWVNGSWLLLRRGLSGATGNWYAGLHEWPDMAFVLHLLRPEDTFVDIGANVGSYTVLASAAVGASSVAFEPVPETFRWLCAQIGLNGITDHVNVHQVAIGRSSGQIKFSLDRDAMNSVVNAEYSGCSSLVQVLAIDSDPRLAGACCWKLDVEGHEVEVLAGAASTLSQAPPQAILCEDRSHEVREILRLAGFHSCTYDPFSRKLTTESPSAGGNELWVRNLTWVQHRLRTAPPFRVLGLSI